MPLAATTRMPRWLSVIAFFALLWNLLGIYAYVMQVTMSPEALSALPDRAMYARMPAWALGAFALAVHLGTLGSLLLLFRSRWSLPVLFLSLAALLVQMYYTFFVANAYATLGVSGLLMPLLVLVISIYLVVLAHAARKRGWLR